MCDIYKIDLSELMKSPGASEKFEGELNLEELIHFEDEVFFDEPLNYELTVSNATELYTVEGFVRGCARYNCVKCLEQYLYDFVVKVKAKAVSADNADPDDPDVFLIEAYRLDIKPVITEFVLLNLPLKKICREDCLGLCPICGVNLNTGKCKCEKDDDIDDRMSALKSLLEK